MEVRECGAVEQSNACLRIKILISLASCSNRVKESARAEWHAGVVNEPSGCLACKFSSKGLFLPTLLRTGLIWKLSSVSGFLLLFVLTLCHRLALSTQFLWWSEPTLEVDKLSCCLESLGPQISHVSSDDRVGNHCIEKVKVLHLARMRFCCCEGLLMTVLEVGVRLVRIWVLLKEPRSWTPSLYRQLAVLLTSGPSGSSQVFVNVCHRDLARESRFPRTQWTSL